jgi:hypothetical protein
VDAPKSTLEAEKTLKTLSSGQIYKNKTKKPEKPQKTPKNHWAGFCKKKTVFFQPWLKVQIRNPDLTLSAQCRSPDLSLVVT